MYLSFSFLLSMRVSSSIHVVANGIILFFFMAEEYSIVYIYHIFLIHSSVDGHLGCFHVLAIMNSAEVNIQTHVSFSLKVLSRYMPKSEIAGSYGSAFFFKRHRRGSSLCGSVEPIRNLEDAGLIPGLIQWVKDLVLP
uniref:Uncharacterized protein n=1 Tax=Sus scrofa TaxID=9823 RepID=A0A4X1TX04_PIG